MNRIDRSFGVDRRRYTVKVLLTAVVTFALQTVSAYAAKIVHSPAPDTSDLKELKYVILAIALAGVLPLAAWIRRHPSIAPKLWMLMGMLPFAQTAVPHLYIALFSWAEWPGYVKGFEFSALDLIALALYISLPRARNSLPFTFSMGLYFLAVILSTFQAEEPTAALFYPWQLFRVYLVYAVVSKSCADARFVPALLNGMGIGLCLEACVVIWQRFALGGVLQPTGTFGHQNLLGLVSHFTMFPFFALLLTGSRNALTFATLLAGAIIVILGASRGAIASAGLGYVILFTLSVLRRPTQWKAVLGVAGAAVMVLLALVAESSLERRFAAAPIGQYDEREAFKLAATRIIEDHPMGVGANNYAFVATTEGYSRQANVASLDPALSPHVHNAYLLTAAETGYFGLFAFLLLLLRPLTVAFLCGWQNRKDRRGELLLGLGVALLIVYIHSFFEWVFMLLEVQYMLAMTVGMVAGLAQQLGYWRRSTVRGKHAFGGLTRQKSFIGSQIRKVPLPEPPPAE